MSDPEVDLERRRGARPKVTGPQTTQIKKGETKAGLRRGAGTPGAGDGFLFAIGRPTQDL